MIELTEEQQGVANLLLQQLDNPKGRNVIVSGQGGVGKTVLISEMVYMLTDNGKKVAVAAPTGKATAVLRGKIERCFEEHGKGIPPEDVLNIQTIAKLTKKSSVVGVTDDGNTLFNNTWQDPAEFAYDVLFVDELSMVSQWFVEWWKRTPGRVFAFGDWAQLPEIGGEESEKEFKSFKSKFAKESKQKWVTGYGTRLLSDYAEGQLHKVLRSDNEIALLCNDLRKTWMTKKEYVDVLKDWSNKTKCIEYTRDLKQANLDDSWQIICFTNKMCEKINNRFARGGVDYPTLEDKIIVEDNINPLQIYNGDTMTLKEFRLAAQHYNQDRVKQNQSPIAICVKWQGRMPNPKSKNPIEREYAATYAYYKNQFKAVQSRRTKNIVKTLNKVLEDKSLKIDDKEATKLVARIERLVATSAQTPEKVFQYAIDLIEKVNWLVGIKVMEASEALPKLYMVNLDYGYAITTHRSQGSEYEKVCYLMEQFNRPLLYTGLSRAKKQIKVIDLT